MKGNGFNLGEVATALFSDVLRGREMQLRELEVVADAEAHPGSDLSEGLSRIEPRVGYTVVMDSRAWTWGI